jgi:hypothetical protein
MILQSEGILTSCLGLHARQFEAAWLILLDANGLSTRCVADGSLFKTQTLSFRLGHQRVSWLAWGRRDKAHDPV